METLHRDDERTFKERCLECDMIFLNRRSHKAGPNGSYSRRLKHNGPFSKDPSRTRCVRCSPRGDAEDDSETSASCNGRLSSGVGEDVETGSRSLRLRIVFPQSCQKTDVDFIGSPCSESEDRNSRGKDSLRLRIRLSKRNQVEPNPYILKEQCEYTEVGQDNKSRGSVGSEVSKRPERRHKLERCEDGEGEGSDHRNRLRLRIDDIISTNLSKKHVSDKYNKRFLVGRSICEEVDKKNSGGIGCARSEYLHIRGGRSKPFDDKAVRSERSGGLFITYDSRRRRTDAQPADLYVSKSRIHGQGLFTRNRIKKGMVIVEFFGEVVRESVSEVRERRYLEEGMQGFYVFSLVGGERKEERFCLDSTRRGGVGRFINHCCVPNSEAEICGGGIVIRAIRDVESGEEITLDYKMREGMEMCWCDAKDCVGIMGG